MQKQPKQLKSTTTGLMVAVALFFDGLQAFLQLIPFLGQILSSLIAIFAFLTFWLWFKLHGINFTTPKRAGFLGGGFLIELIPILNALPAWTLAVVLITADLKIKNSTPDKTAESGEKDKAA